MALRNTFEIPIGGRASIKVTIELHDDDSGASRANRLLIAQITGKVTSAVAETDHRGEIDYDQGSKQEPAQVNVECIKPAEHVEVNVILASLDNRRSYELKPTTTIGKIMELEEMRSGIPAKRMRAMLRGRQLMMEDSLEECNFQSGNTIFMQLTLRGS